MLNLCSIFRFTDALCLSGKNALDTVCNHHAVLLATGKVAKSVMCEFYILNSNNSKEFPANLDAAGVGSRNRHGRMVLYQIRWTLY